LNGITATTQCEDLLDLIDDDDKNDDHCNISYNDESHVSLSEAAEISEVADIIGTPVATGLVSTESISANNQNSSIVANGNGEN
jgi:hypothetical protein